MLTSFDINGGPGYQGAVVVPDVSLNYLVGTPQMTLAAMKMSLFTNDVQPDRASVLGTFVEATFDGYSNKTISVSGEGLDGDGNSVQEENLCHWQKTAGANSDTIRGIFVTTADGLTLLAAARLPQDVAMATNGDQLIVLLSWIRGRSRIP